MSQDNAGLPFVLRIVLAVAAFATVAAGVAELVGVLRAPSLIVEDVARARVLYRERVKAGDTFSLAYVHSSEQVPVRGVVRVEADGSLTVTETAFAGFGPGLPELTAGDVWRLEGGMIVARTPVPRLPELTVRVVPLTRHRLVTPAGQELDLSTLMAPGGAVKIRVR